jgi:hypothetical protein
MDFGGNLILTEEGGSPPTHLQTSVDLFVKLQGYNRLFWLHLPKQASVEHAPKIACNSAEPEQAFLCPN